MVDFRAYLRSQLQFTHGTMEQVVADIDPDTLHHVYPGSTANHIAAIYAHAVTAEDGIVNGLALGRMPIFNAETAAKTGVPMKQSPAMEDAWASQIKMDLAAFRAYAAQVYAATEAAINDMTDAQADEVINTPFGAPQPRLEFMGNLTVVHAWGHMGEIAAIKGMKGLKGLPF
ncbi:MAG: DinB family protein [bacterium]